jgi:hypothetical protein
MTTSGKAATVRRVVRHARYRRVFTPTMVRSNYLDQVPTADLAEPLPGTVHRPIVDRSTDARGRRNGPEPRRAGRACEDVLLCVDRRGARARANRLDRLLSAAPVLDFSDAAHRSVKCRVMRRSASYGCAPRVRLAPQALARMCFSGRDRQRRRRGAESYCR